LLGTLLLFRPLAGGLRDGLSFELAPPLLAGGLVLGQPSIGLPL